MIGSIRGSWDNLAEGLWIPLANFRGTKDEAPVSLFSDLMTTADDYLAPRLTDAEFEAVRNDPYLARERFLQLEGVDFTNESAAVIFLEDVVQVLEEYEINGYAAQYSKLLEDIFAKYNLRYRVQSPFAIRFLIPGSFGNLYSELLRVGATNAHLSELLEDFEKSFDRYSRMGDNTDLKATISNASKYLEGLASTTSGKTGSLGETIKEINMWPHKAVLGGLSSLYGFCSDYPGIRHAGNPIGKQRDLSSRDLSVICLLLLSYAGYLSPQIDPSSVMGV